MFFIVPSQYLYGRFVQRALTEFSKDQAVVVEVYRLRVLTCGLYALTRPKGSATVREAPYHDHVGHARPSSGKSRSPVSSHGVGSRAGYSGHYGCCSTAA